MIVVAMIAEIRGVGVTRTEMKYNEGPPSYLNQQHVEMALKGDKRWCRVEHLLDDAVALTRQGQYLAVPWRLAEALQLCHEIRNDRAPTFFGMLGVDLPTSSGAKLEIDQEESDAAVDGKV